MLWLALHFPLLPLEALPLRQSPSAVVSRGRVWVCDSLATEAGIKRDQRLSTALGLQPGLAVFERDEAREVMALHGLACWAGRFTPTLSVLPPATLLLEISGCLRLFGGAAQIVEQALAGCAEQSFTVAWAAGPTPLGVFWLASANAGVVYQKLPDLQVALTALPCQVAGWPDETLARLGAFGLKNLGDLRKLPAAGLRRRLGNAPMDDLARAWGELPHPQRAFIFPEVFLQKIELPARVEHAEALAFAAQRLFSALLGWLQARQLLVRACTLELTHDDGSHTDLPLRFAEPTADELRFSRLLREHLGRLQLSAPVAALSLHADEVLGKPGESAPLFDQAVAGEGALLCLERLRARLGQDAVQVLAQRPDYRPECATHSQAIDEKMTAFSPSTVTIKGARPLWLLPAPQALAEVAGRPSWHGRLSLLSSAERLESGWWDEGENQATGDVRRDYFVARNPLGQWVWIFRDAQAWYLHGLFA
ncbi:MAG: DNA polymerase Y family protein [Rhodocyclaceae bacterium]|nr:DNA polymerase Y family protein [Rhodocyclaceae bacterium]